MNTRVSEIFELSVAERIQIVEDIWDSIAAKPDEFPLSDDDRAELDRRLLSHEKNPDDGTSWEDLRERLIKSRRMLRS